MELTERLARLAPVAAIGLVAPLLFAAIAAGLPDGRLASLEGQVVIEGLPGDQARAFSDQEPVVNVTVNEVLDAQPGLQLEGGDRIEVLVPAYGLGSQALRPGGNLVIAAVSPAEKHDPANGTTVWQGWRLSDAKDGWLWGLQAQVVQGALLALIPNVGGAALVGYALGLPRQRRGPIPEVDAPPATAGLALGLLLAGLIGTAGGNGTWLYPSSADGIPVAGTAAAVVGAMGAVGALWQRPRVLPNGGRTATVVGLGLLVAYPAGLLLLWEGQLTSAFQLITQLQLLAVVGAIGVLVVAGARWLRLRWARYLAGALVLAPPAYLLTTGWLFLSLALPMLLVSLAGVRDLWGPNLVAGPG